MNENKAKEHVQILELLQNADPESVSTKDKSSSLHSRYERGKQALHLIRLAQNLEQRKDILKFVKKYIWVYSSATLLIVSGIGLAAAFGYETIDEWSVRALVGTNIASFISILWLIASRVFKD